MREKIRVVLADDHAIVRTGLKAVLGTAGEIEVVGEASTGREALVLIEQWRPEVVVMDLSMPDLDGITTTKAITESKSHTRVLVLTMHEEEDYLIPLLEAGAAGYLVKSAADRELVTAVRTVAQGETYIGQAAARVLAKRITQKDPLREDRERFQKLTPREREVLRLIAQGYSAPEIGARLAISHKTVETYKQRVHDKLGIAHRAEYVQLALRLGLLATE